MSTNPTPELRNQLIVGDALTTLRTLPDNLVDCVVTSPPYYQLRDYGHPDQLGHEPDVRQWVQHLTAVFDELQRVLKPTGNAWLNLADTYSRHARQGARRKSLLFGPERLLLALAAHGWIVRNKIIWAKTNPMPHSVRDRFSGTWEYLYLLTTSETGYWFDLDAVRIPHRTADPKPTANVTAWTGSWGGINDGLTRLKRQGRAGHPKGKNPGDVWRLAKAAHRGQHSATYPSRLIEIPIRAGCPPTTCVTCGKPTCAHGTARRPGLVLDPFIGTGTTAHVAGELGRDWLGIDITTEHFTPPQQQTEAA